MYIITAIRSQIRHVHLLKRAWCHRDIFLSAGEHAIRMLGVRRWLWQSQASSPASPASPFGILDNKRTGEPTALASLVVVRPRGSQVSRMRHACVHPPSSHSKTLHWHVVDAGTLITGEIRKRRSSVMITVTSGTADSNDSL